MTTAGGPIQQRGNEIRPADGAVHGVSQWRQVVSERLMPLWIDADDAPSFTASVVAGEFDGVRLFTVRVGPHVAERTKRLARTGDPHYWLAYQIAGESTIIQAGHRSVLHPGELAVYDSTMPYRREFPAESETLVVLVPQQLISLPPKALARVAGLCIGRDDALGEILSSFLRAVAGNLSQLGANEGRSVVQALVTLMTSALASKMGVPQDGSSRRLEQLTTIRDGIMTQLGNTDLKPSSIAAANFMSTRQLHSLFRESRTTISAWIRSQRLEMARRDLATPGADEEIRTIAQRWGFEDPAYFARVFRAAYGLSPRQFRRGTTRMR